MSVMSGSSSPRVVPLVPLSLLFSCLSCQVPQVTVYNKSIGGTTYVHVQCTLMALYHYFKLSSDGLPAIFLGSISAIQEASEAVATVNKKGSLHATSLSSSSVGEGVLKYTSITPYTATFAGPIRQLTE